MAKEIKAIEWTGDDQFSPDYGRLQRGDVIILSERGIPQRVAETWIRDGWAVEQKQMKQAEKAKEA